MLAPRKTLHSTPLAVIQQAFDLAQVSRKDVICDIGCGDGRVLLHAATKLQVSKCIGIEIDRNRVEKIQAEVNRLRVQDRVRVYCGNALDIELEHEISVFFLFLIERGLRQVFRQLLDCTTPLRHKEIRILTYLYRIESMDPYLVATKMCHVEEDPLSHESVKRHAKFPIYLYVLPQL